MDRLLYEDLTEDDWIEFYSWLNKNGYTKKEIEEVLEDKDQLELFIYIWEQQHL
tara:strand:+ start:813 stop:974 length:162 start_codon:yes stop_codon:yes gene_type:complete